MSQRATSFILNCGPSMEIRLPGHEKTAFQEGMEIIVEAASEKILNGRKTDKMNIILSGTKETDNELAEANPGQYNHVTTVCPFDLPNIGLLRHLVNQTSSDLDGTNADIFDALILAIHILVKNFGHLRYTKQIVLISDAANLIDWRDAETVLNMLQAKDIKLVVIGVGFDAGGIIKAEDEDPKSVAIKAKNQKEWKNMVDSIPGATMYNLQEAYENAKGMKTKEIKPTASFRGFLNIGDPINHNDRALAIGIHMYPHMMEAKPPTAKKWSTLSYLTQSEEASTSEPRPLSHAVEMIRKYVVMNSDAPDESSSTTAAVSLPSDTDTPMDGEVSNDTLKGVDENVLEKVYPFGKTLVKISSDEEAYLGMNTTPGMWIIGFLRKSAVPRHYFLSKVFLILGDPTDKEASGLAIATLARSLYEKGAVALVRLVRKQGSEPEIGILSPYIDVDVNLLQYCQIPFAEDLRHYTFNSLDKVTIKSGKVIEQDHPLLPTPEMKESMATFVEMMDLNTDDDYDYYVPEDTFNPLIWRCNTAIKVRALNEAAPIPKMHPKLEKDMSVLPKFEEKCADHVKNMISLFNIKKVDKKIPEKRRYGTDRDSLADSDKMTPIEQVMAGDDEFGGPKRSRTENANLGRAAKKVEQLTIGTSDPVKDFKAMLNNEEDLVTAAVTQMCDLIIRLATTSFGDQHYSRIMACLKACREAAAKENEAGLFNQCLYQLKQLIKPSDPTSTRIELWQLLQKESINLITKEEADDDEVANVTKDDADKFMNDMEQADVPQISSNNDDEMTTEDLLLMMD